MKREFGIWFMIVTCLLTPAAGQNYRGAELRTLESFQYGRFETSLRSVEGDGFLCSFFSYNDEYPMTQWAEIDFEVLGRWPNNIDVNVIDEGGSHLRQHPVDFNTHMDFHDYAFEWTPEYVAWFIDGTEFYRQTEEHITDLQEPQKLMMNIWTPAYADWVGTLDPRVLPRFAHYDWVSYAAHTPGSGSVGTDNNFTPVWLDPFDSFDSTRWEKSDGHSWNGNLATLVADNIVYEDGNMVLCLTLPGEEGLQDHHPAVALWARLMTADSVVVRFSEVLDPVTANRVATYVIPGASIQTASLQADQMTVGLKLASALTAASANVYALGLKDQAQPPNTQMGTQAAISMPDPLPLPIRIDCAGPGRQGFLPEQLWSSAVEYGHEGGNYQAANSFPDLLGTDLDSVMATSLNRYSRYHVRLEPGRFDIALHFAEHYYTAPGQRTFELYVEDSLVVAELDVYALGGNDQIVTVNLWDQLITDGSMDIIGSALAYGWGYAYSGPLLNAIEISGDYFVGAQAEQQPAGYALQPIYPNPFNSSTHLRFNLPVADHIDLSLFDLRGRRIRDLGSGSYPAGEHGLNLTMSNLSSGIYIVRLESTNYQDQQKILLLK